MSVADIPMNLRGGPGDFLELLPRGDGMLDMAVNAVSKAVPWCMVGASTALVSARGWDSGVIIAFVGGTGMAVLGLIFEFRRRRLEAEKLETEARLAAIRLEAVARAEALKVESEAKSARERLALEHQISLDQMREKSYAGTLTEQLTKMQKSVEEGNEIGRAHV